mmetsp:Transcript_46514/g.101189  ORF Transcript_46514/g.101189 Transcript_46514/m.101189 type:complete len:590 (+) Transcript_46514:3-1772(+)
MNDYKEGDFVDHSKSTISYQDFINKELVQFSRYDLMRSVPSVMDGLKPTQRKVLFSCFKRNLRSDAKVAQLVGYIGEHSAYHHGESSLSSTIVSMAQDFVGSNNVNLLVPSGQFGTRASGGKDSASARYIYTRLSPITRLIFSPLDDAVLDYQMEEGQKIEPYWYAPIIPMVLVNGAEGIGTGWSTSVPNYDPRELIANMRLFIKKSKMKSMKPWYRGFSGTIKPAEEKGKYECVGVHHKTSSTMLQITELPLKKWTQDYKEFLHTLLPGSEKRGKLQVHDVREYHTENKVHFEVRMDAAKLKGLEEGEGIDAAFRLRGTVSETNMVMFDSEGKIKKYKDVLEIMAEFAKIRLEMYEVRKKYLIDKLTLEKELLANRARFISMIVAKTLHVNNRKKADLVKDLIRLKFRKFGDTAPPRTGYEYLLVMQIQTLTAERKLELERILKAKTAELNDLTKTTVEQLWVRDLDALEASLTKLYSADTEGDAAVTGSRGKKRKANEIDGQGSLKAAKPRGAGARGRRSKGGRGRGRGQAIEEDEEEEAAGEQTGENVEEVDDLGENLFADVQRWTAGYLKGPSGLSSFRGKKQRR